MKGQLDSDPWHLFQNSSLCGQMFSFFPGKCLGVELLIIQSAYLTLEETAQVFSKWLYNFALPVAMYENTSYFLIRKIY